MIGRELTAQLLSDDDYDEVRVFVRRDVSLSHQKLKQLIVDFDQPETFAKDLIGEVLFSCLGTTLKIAGSQHRQYEIDHDLNLRLAELACDQGVPAYVLLSSTGASPGSRMFYLRMKGELERDVSVLPFQSIRILRPGILDGDRQEDRPGERFALGLARLLPHWSSLAAYRPAHARIVARALRAAAADWSPGPLVIEANEIFILGEDGDGQ
jgi:uncharacterized protein YbjT (DUF2867 family)